MAKINKKEMRKWEVESAMNTLQRAAEIQNNTSLMRDVKKFASAEAKKLQTLASGGSVKRKIKKPKAKRTIKRKK